MSMTESHHSPILVIDRIEVIIYIPDADHYRYLYRTMWDLKSEGRAKTWRNKFQTRSTIALSSSESLFMEIGGTHRKNYVKFGWQPDALNDEAWLELYALCATLFDFGYLTLFNDAKVTYIEIAADYRYINITNLLVFDARVKNSTILPSFPEPVQTIYIGHRKHSPRRFCIYNKARQLRKVKDTEVDGELTRIETRLRRTGLSPRNLNELTNPFTTLSVCTKLESRALLPSQRFAAFMDQCDERGANAALHKCSLARRKQFSGILRRASCDWWQPETLWERWPQALQVLAPRYDLPI